MEPTGCVSGCSEGHVVHWDMRSGNCVHDLGEYGIGVVKVESTRESTVGLFAENTIIVWDNFSGETVYTLAMDDVCGDFAVLSGKYLAACFESHITLYDLENGQKHSEKQLDSERGVSFLRHILPLQDGSSVVCSCGKDVHIIPCQLKLKTD